MSNLQGRTIGYPTFIGHIHKAMLTVMDSSDKFRLSGETDNDAPFGFSTSICLPL